MGRFLRRLSFLLVVLGFAAYVWPSAYRYDHMTVDGDTYPVRIHRITGHADILMPEQGWIPSEQPWDQGPDATPGDGRT